jgi:hypothetical protein
MNSLLSLEKLKPHALRGMTSLLKITAIMVFKFISF